MSDDDIYSVFTSSLFGKFKERFDTQAHKGRVAATLDAIVLCGETGEPLPDWVTATVKQARDQFNNLEAASLDDAFEHKPLTGRSIGRKKFRADIRFKVYQLVNEAINQGTPIDEALFVSIGKEVGAGKTVVSELYYETKKYIST
jgi:hypothetical protein